MLGSVISKYIIEYVQLFKTTNFLRDEEKTKDPF